VTVDLAVHQAANTFHHQLFAELLSVNVTTLKCALEHLLTVDLMSI